MAVLPGTRTLTLTLTLTLTRTLPLSRCASGICLAARERELQLALAHSLPRADTPRQGQPHRHALERAHEHAERSSPGHALGHPHGDGQPHGDGGLG